MPDILFEPFASWSRFDFSAASHAGDTLWEGARASKDGGCVEVSMQSDDPSISPPLSAAELAYQCNGSAPPCKLLWYPGKGCYDIVPNATWPGGIDGYAQRAVAYGYRTVAGPSATTANMMQLAALLNFDDDEQVRPRDACLHAHACMQVT